MFNHGDIVAGASLIFPFDTSDPTGAGATLSGTPAARVYKDGSTAESAAGVSVSVDHDGRTGLHVITVNTAADGTFYAAGSDFFVVLTVGTVSGVSVAPKVIGAFSIQNRSNLSAAGIRAAVGLGSANLDTQFDDLPTVGEIAAVVPTAAENADKVLGRNLAGGSDGGRTVRDALRFSRNRVEITPTGATTFTIDVYKEDDTTIAWSGTGTRAEADAIQSVNPA